MKILVKKDWYYTLYMNEKEEYFFSVLCGSIAQFELNIQLNEEEIENYKKSGEKYLDRMAEFISSNYRDWENRSIKTN